MAELQYISKSGHLVISKNGNVGIGIVDPSSKLEVNGNILATSFVKSGGTSSQFLKADGSVDSSIYLTAESDTLQSVTDRGNTIDNAIITSNGVPLYFTNTGTGTYNKGVMYSNTTDGFTFEAPWETDATTTRVPFILTWRGGIGQGGIKLNGDTQIYTDDDGVGIDITDPGAKLHVGGRSIFDGLMTINDGNNYARLGDLNSNSTMVLELKDGTNPVQIEAYSEEMRFYQGASLAMKIAGKTVINPDNEVGKGLQVYYDMDLYNTLRLTDASMTEQGRIAASSGVLTVQGNSEISFVINSVGAANFDSSGNLNMAGTRRVTFNGSTQYLASDGSDLDLGSADDINFRSSYMRFFNASAGYEYARLHGEQGSSWVNANGGQFGIGTDTPAVTLNVVGEIRGEQSGSHALRLIGSGSANAQIYGTGFTYGMNLSTSETSSAYYLMSLNSGSINRFYVRNDGNVGIGNDSPDRKLTVNGNASFREDVRIYTDATTNQGGITMYDPDGGGYLSIAVTDDEHASGWGWQFQSNFADDDTGTTYFRIGYNGADSYLDSGKFGIGTDSPSQALHVEGRGVFDSGASSDIIEFRNDNGGYIFGNTANLASIDLSSGSALRIRQGSSTPFYISTTGQLGINTTDPLGGKFHLKQGTAAFEAPGSGSAAIDGNTHALIIGPHRNRDSTADRYYGGIAFNHLLNYNNGGGYNAAAHGWIGLRLYDTPSSERSNLVFATKEGTSLSDIPIERMTIDPFGKVGIGTGSPLAKLQVQGSVTDQKGEVVQIYNTSSNSSYKNTVNIGDDRIDTWGLILGKSGINTPDSGYHSPDGAHIVNVQNGDLRFGTNNTTRMTIDNGGSVGIGTDSPSNTLHVAGSTFLSDDVYVGDGSNHLLFTTYSTVGGAYSGSFGWNSLQLGNNGGNYILAGNTAAGGQLGIYTNVTSRYRYGVEDVVGTLAAWFDNSGRVGIGVSSLDAKLQVGDTQNSNATGVSFCAGSAVGNLIARTTTHHNWFPYTDGNNYYSADNHIFRNANHNTEWLRINSSGYVGVNQTNPQARLHVGGRIRIDNPSTTGGTNVDQAIYIEHPSLSGEYFTMGFKDTARSGEKMQHPSGPYTNSSAFYIECGSTEAGGICLDQDSVHVYGSSDGGATFRVIDKDADVVTFEMLQTSWNGVFRGDVIAYGSMSSLSDKRIKENIEPYDNVLDKLCTLGVYSYNKITAPEDKKDRKEVGVIAQEVEQVFPELVGEEKVGKPKDVNGLETVKTVDYEHLTAILLQSIKELREEVNELKTKINIKH